MGLPVGTIVVGGMGLSVGTIVGMGVGQVEGTTLGPILGIGLTYGGCWRQ